MSVFCHPFHFPLSLFIILWFEKLKKKQTNKMKIKQEKKISFVLTACLVSERKEKTLKSVAFANRKLQNSKILPLKRSCK
mmetsp:Transcript_40365/g.46260  ORF Transcript_40365/g.46260 Transcript_40365/m.46260 type:complete len:80 (+) Transcript_40365:661-900(+)